MKLYKILLIVILAGIITSCSREPEVLFVNGKIYTLDKNNSVVEAVAVREGKILETGKSEDLKSKYKPKELIDLQGKTVLPGFIDMEGSLIEFSKNLNYINLTQARSIKEIKQLVSEKAKGMKPASWIGGFGWNELNLSEEDLIKMDKSLLDEVSSGMNVYLVNLTSTTVWCNTKLLETLRITNQTPSPKNGEIEKDEKGNLTGLLFDGAINLVKEKIPDFTKEDISYSVEKGAAELLKYGITGIHDKTVTKDAITIYRDLIDNDKLPLKIYAVLSAGDTAVAEYFSKGIEINYKDKLTVRAVSVDFDGSLELQAAVMKDEYKQDPKVPAPYTSPEGTETFLRQALEKNFQFVVKTVGDKAVTVNLNILEKILKEKKGNDTEMNSGQGFRTVFEYVEFIQPDDFKRMKDLKIIVSVRPEITLDTYGMIKSKIPPDNAKNLGLWKSIIDNTGMLTTGSNFPYGIINPFVQIYYLTARQSLDSVSVVIPGQTISLLDAVKSYTVWAAYAGFEENVKGTIEKDKYADMIVLSDDIFSVASKKIPDIKVLKTILNGKVVSAQ